MVHDNRNASQNLYDFIDFSALNYGEILSFITPESRKKVRLLEKLLKKQESLNIGEKFIQSCLREGLLPKFTENIYINVKSIFATYSRYGLDFI